MNVGLHDRKDKNVWYWQNVSILHNSPALSTSFFFFFCSSDLRDVSYIAHCSEQPLLYAVMQFLAAIMLYLSLFVGEAWFDIASHKPNEELTMVRDF